MSIIVKPSLVKDGLTAHLDFTLGKYYTTGSGWTTELISKTPLPVNSDPQADSNNIFITASLSQSITLPSSITGIKNPPPFSICVWTNFIDNNGQGFLNTNTPGSVYSGVFIARTIVRLGNNLGAGSANRADYSYNSAMFPTSEWSYFVITVPSSNLVSGSIYKNAVSQSYTLSGTTTDFAYGSNDGIIGGGANSGGTATLNYPNVRIGSVSFYNRELTLEEISQNFEIGRKIYGI